MQTSIEILVGVLLAIGFVLLVRRSGSYAKEKLNYSGFRLNEEAAV